MNNDSQSFLHAFLCILICLSLGTTLVIPVFQRKTQGFDVQEAVQGIETIEAVADEQQNDIPEPYIYHYAPENSFGASSFKEVNWSYFKSLFRNNFDVTLEYNLDNGVDEWIEGNQFLDVGYDWQDEGFWKINFTFSKPQTPVMVDARFTVVMNLNVLNYVEADQGNPFCYFLNYTVPNTNETYHTYFNWSDMIGISGLIFNHGVQEGKFWFRFRKNDITTDSGEWVFDPTFGYTDAEGSINIYYNTGDYNVMRGFFASPASDGTVDNITIKTYNTTTGFADLQCALYEYVDYSSSYAGDLIAVTEIKQCSFGSLGDGAGFYTLNFSSPPFVSSTNNYYIIVRLAEDLGAGNSDRFIYGKSGTSGTSIYYYSSDEVTFDDPLTNEATSQHQPYMYASYTEGVPEGEPTFSNPTPASNSYNISLSNTIVNTTVTDDDGNSSTVDFYTSLDGSSWTHRQTNLSVLNESVSYDMSSVLTEYQTTYYWKVTANDTDGNNGSVIYNFETTPYRDNYFNDTFPTENWIDTSYNMSDFEYDWQNYTYGTSGTTTVFYDNFAGTDKSELTTFGNWSDGGGDYKYQFEHDGTTSSSTGPAIMCPGGTGQYVYTEASSRFDKSHYLDSDTFTGSSNISIDFYYHMYGSNMGTLYVQIWDGSSWDTIWSKSGQQNSGTTDPFKKATAWSEDGDSAPYTGTTKIRFWGQTGDQYRSDMAFDRIYVNVTTVGNQDAYIISKNITKPTGYDWDKFYSDVNDTGSCSFAIIDPSDDTHNISSGLVGDGDDISSITNNTIRIYGNFSDSSVSMGSWNITWASSGSPTEAWNQDYSYYWTGGNISAFNEDYNYWFTGGNATVSYSQQYSCYWTGGNITLSNSEQYNHWWTGGNRNTYTKEYDYWFTGGNLTLSNAQQYNYWHTGGNTTVEFNEEYNYWWTGSNISTSPDSIVINFAGNLSDQGGPYYRPSGETTQLTGDWSDGYYTNSSCQQEDWIYINASIPNATSVWLNWINETTYTNWTYSFSNTGGTYWEINTSGTIQTCEGFNYSFDVYANGTGGEYWVGWNKTGTGGTLTRRYVQLNCTPSTIEYTPYYLSKAIFSNGLIRDRLHHDQGDGGGSANDTGYVTSELPDDTISLIWCFHSDGFWLDESVCIPKTTLDNIYYHLWYTSDTGNVEVGTENTRIFFSGTFDDNDDYTVSENKSKIYYNNGLAGVNDNYYLMATKLDLSDADRTFTDNDIYEMSMKIKKLNEDPSFISNRSFTGFVLFNVPDNATLNASDSDSDNINDWYELYKLYTNPFLSDTDNDGVSDYDENLSGSDPNNYTDTIAYSKSWNQDYSYWWTGGNESTYTEEYDYWYTGGNSTVSNVEQYNYYWTGGNIDSYNQDYSYYWSGGNISTYSENYNYWHTGGNTTVEFNEEHNYWYTGGNASTHNQDYSYWWSGGNISVFDEEFSNWYTGGNVTNFNQDYSYYWTGGNITVLWNEDHNYYWTGGNTTGYNQEYNYYWTGGNISTWSQDYSYYWTGGNLTLSNTQQYNYYWTGGNNTLTHQQDYTYWWTGGNNSTSGWQEDHNIWWTGGNISTWSQDYTYWWTGGNLTVSNAEQYNYWYTGGNGSQSHIQQYNYYWTGGNISTYSEDYNYWWTGGNSTVSWKEHYDYNWSGGQMEDFDERHNYWFSGGNSSDFSGSFTINVDGQTITVTPDFGNEVDEYKWQIEGTNSDGETYWIDVNDAQSHQFIGDFNDTITITLLFKNETLTKQLRKTIKTGSREGFNLEPETITDNSIDEETSKYKPISDSLPENIKQWLKNRSILEWIFIMAVFLIILILVLTSNKKKRVLYITTKKKKNRGKNK